jgi:hypothetical protein
LRVLDSSPNSIAGFALDFVLNFVLNMQLRCAILIAFNVAATTAVRGDGLLLGPPAAVAAVPDIPQQRALIAWADGRERLVIETAFVARGTNFAWLLPLPAPPEIRAVDGGVFTALENAFAPRLVHHVRLYCLGFLFITGLVVLGQRAIREEPWLPGDIALVVALAGGTWWVTRHPVPGLVVLGLGVYTRVLARTGVSAGLAAVAGLMFLGLVHVLGPAVALVDTLGDAEPSLSARVEVLSVQRAGVFKSTTLRGSDPRAVAGWLTAHGFEAPAAMELIVGAYLRKGWVVVASRVGRETSEPVLDALHPVGFEFPTPEPIYPLALTALGVRQCRIHLYVFGPGRAAASRFAAIRSGRVVANGSGAAASRSAEDLDLGDPELVSWVGGAPNGTQLVGTLQARDMGDDAVIRWRRAVPTGATVYSRSAAARIALNLAVPLAVLGWVLTGTTGNGGHAVRGFLGRLRAAVVAVALLAGLWTYGLLPKTDVVSVAPGSTAALEAEE